MIDLETWGRLPGCAIRSIGAVGFELDGAISDNTFYANIDEKSCWMHGLRIEQETVNFWSEQPAHIIKQLEKNQQPLFIAVRDFHMWFWKMQAQYVWAHGVTFDVPVWEHAARAVDCKIPWRYWDTRCCRSVCDIVGVEPHKEKRQDNRHHALADAIHQVRCLQKAIRILHRDDDRWPIDADRAKNVTRIASGRS